MKKDIGIACHVFSYFQIAFSVMPAEKSAIKMRTGLFRSIMRQNIGWFDVYKSGELNNRLTEYLFFQHHIFT